MLDVAPWLEIASCAFGIFMILILEIRVEYNSRSASRTACEQANNRYVEVVFIGHLLARVEFATFVDVLATSVAAHREWARKTDTFELRCSAVGLLLSCNSASIKVRWIVS